MRHPRRSRKQQFDLVTVRVAAHKKWAKGHKFRGHSGIYLKPLNLATKLQPDVKKSL